ncbi:hypothetical protein H0H81_004697, partial [Sphagnurus paluster]
QWMRLHHRAHNASVMMDKAQALALAGFTAATAHASFLLPPGFKTASAPFKTNSQDELTRLHAMLHLATATANARSSLKRNKDMFHLNNGNEVFGI